MRTETSARPGLLPLKVALLGSVLSSGAIAPFLYGVDATIPPSYLISHFLVILVAQVLSALIFAGFAEDRAWAGAVFAIPVTLALWPTAARIGGAVGVIGISVAAAAAVAIWALRFVGAGAPLVSGTGGTILGALLMMFRREHTEGLQADPLLVATYGLAGIAIGVASLVLPHWTGRGKKYTPGFAPLAVGLLAIVAYSSLGVRARGVSPPPGNSAQPSVVLIVLDTLRTDHVAGDETANVAMPRLSRFVDEHLVRAGRGVSTSSWSLPSHASMFTGLYPPRHGAHALYIDTVGRPIKRWYPLRETTKTLAEHLRERGYWTVGISANYGPLSADYGFDRGFDSYVLDARPCHALRDRTPWQASTRTLWQPLAWLDRLPPFGDCGFFGEADRYRPAEEITDDAIEVLKRSEGRPLFLFLNYFDPHQPLHDRTRRFGERYTTSYETEQATWRGEPLDEAEQKRMTDLYKSELQYLDTHLTRFLEEFAASDTGSGGMLIIASDHGASMGEHGLLTHGTSLYEEQISVPFFLTPPGGIGQPAGDVAIDMMQSVDILPTVLQQIGAEVPDGLDGVPWGAGRSLARAWLFVDPRRAKENPSRFSRETQSVQQGEWKLIAYTSGPPELYNLEQDPRELHNLAPSRPELVENLAALLWDRSSYAEPNRTGTDGMDPQLLDRLRSLGYIQ